MGSWMGRKLGDTWEAVSQTHLHIWLFGSVQFSSMLLLTLSILGERGLAKYCNAPEKKKKNNFNETSFCVFPYSDCLWKTCIKFTEKKDSSFSPPTPVVTLSMSQSKCQKKKASSQENINIYRQHYSITPEMLNRASSPFLFFIDLVMWYIIIRKPKKKGNSRTQSLGHASNKWRPKIILIKSLCDISPESGHRNKKSMSKQT